MDKIPACAGMTITVALPAIRGFKIPACAGMTLVEA